MQFSSAIFITSCSLLIFVAGREGGFPNNYSEIRGHQLAIAIPFSSNIYFLLFPIIVTFLRGLQLLWLHFFAVLWSSSEHLRDPSKDGYTLLACEKEKNKGSHDWYGCNQLKQQKCFSVILEFMVRVHDFVLIQFLCIFFNFPFSISCELFSSISFDDHWPLTNLERLKGDQNRFAALNLGSWGENSQVNMRFER